MFITCIILLMRSGWWSGLLFKVEGKGKFKGRYVMLNVDAFVQASIAKLDQLMAGGTQGVTVELKQSVRMLLQDALTRMDLLSREEFDVQTEVLRATQKKLALIEHRLAEMESTLRSFKDELQNESDQCH